MKNNIETILTNGTVVKIQAPENPSKVAVLLHGFTGDESSMWVFTSKLSSDWLLIAPRAPFISQGTDLGGYSWIDQPITSWPVYQDFLPMVNRLGDTIHDLKQEYFPDIPKIHLAGFSQGAAMAFVFANSNPDIIHKVGLLAGFLPDSSEGFLNDRLKDRIKFFIGHGQKDHIVPVEKAQFAYHTLSEFGIPTQLCLSDVGHKLGSDCFDAFTAFMEKG